MNVLKGQTPDITTGQIAALLTFVVGQAVAYGWVTDHTAQLAISVGSTVLAAAWKLADAYLRGSRAKAALGPTVPAAPPTSPPAA
jgi:hypothetical protein